MGAMACAGSISAVWPRIRGEVGVRRDRARGVFIGAAAWARGLGFRARGVDRTTAVACVTSAVSGGAREMIGGPRLLVSRGGGGRTLSGAAA
jgi:hypothetical protein